MIRNFLTISILLFSIATLSAQLNYSKVKIDLTQTPITQIAALGFETDHGAYAPGKHLINDFSEVEVQRLIANNIPHEILIEDVIAWYQERNLEGTPASVRDESCGGPTAQPGDQYATPANYQLGSMGGYHTYTEMLEVLDQMQNLYPELISAREPIPDITTHQNRPIYWMAISDNPADQEGEPEILYTALHHAREANSLSQMLFYMWYLLENYETNDQIKYLVDNTRMYFIPCVNPDGYVFNEIIEPNGGGLWRKNRKDNNDNTFGVDLNRNYGYLWGADDIGSSPDTDSETYRGEGPFSEPETQAIAAFVEDKNIEITLNCHTFSNLLIHPEDIHPADTITYQNFGEILTAENGYKFGNALETVGYSVNGESDSWMYFEEISKPKIFAMTPEVGPIDFGFWPPSDAIIGLNKAVMSQNIIAASLLFNYLELKDNNPFTITDVSGSFEFSAKEYGLRLGPQTVTISPVSSNLTIPVTTESFTLNTSEIKNISTPYTVTPIGNNESEAVVIAIRIENDYFTRHDTITKRFINGVLEDIVEEDNNSLANYSTTGDWALSMDEFVSAPSSITDSPMGRYQNNTNSEIILDTPLDLTTSSQAILKYWAKWDIEEAYDYVQIMASDDNGNSWTPLCGKYTNLASEFQPTGEQLYDGTQNDWVLEEVNLNAYLGETILLKFSFFSDDIVDADGFYFDDLSVTVYQFDITPTENLFSPLTDLRVSPNPFSDDFSVKFDLVSSANQATVSLINALGQTIESKNYGNLSAGRHRFDWSGSALGNGVYFIQYRDADGQEKTVRLVK